MKISMQSTTKLVTLNNVPARIWEGTTDSGIRIHAYVTRIAIGMDESEENMLAVLKELIEHAPPTAEIDAIPGRLII